MMVTYEAPCPHCQTVVWWHQIAEGPGAVVTRYDIRCTRKAKSASPAAA